MKRWIVLAAGLLLAFQALAADTVRFGSKVITLGDSEEKVVQIAGEPVRKVEVQNVYGALRGYRLDYVQGRKTVQIYIAHGQVVHIKELF